MWDRRLLVYAWLLFRRFFDIFHTMGKVSDGFRQVYRKSEVVQGFVDIKLGVSVERFDASVVFHDELGCIPDERF